MCHLSLDHLTRLTIHRYLTAIQQFVGSINCFNSSTSFYMIVIANVIDDAISVAVVILSYACDKLK